MSDDLAKRQSQLALDERDVESALRRCHGRQQLELLGMVKELARKTADGMWIEPAHRTPEPENLGAVEKKGGNSKPLAFVNREVAGIGYGLCQDGAYELLMRIEPDDQRRFWLAGRFQHDWMHNNGSCSANAVVTLCRLRQLGLFATPGGRLYVYCRTPTSGYGAIGKRAIFSPRTDPTQISLPT